MTSRVPVTGGSGKLGRAVVAELRAHEWDVVNLDRAAPAVEVCPFTRIDFTDYGQTIQALTTLDGRCCGIDAVVHLAAIPGPGVAANAATFANNITSTYNVVTVAIAGGVCNIVWASSETPLGLPFAPDTPPPYLPVDEEYAARPEKSYALAKHLEEQLCRWHPDLKMIGLRFSNVMESADYARFPDYDLDPSLRRWNACAYIDAATVLRPFVGPWLTTSSARTASSLPTPTPS